MLCDGYVLLHIQSQKINLPVVARCHLLHQEMHIIAGEVMEDDRNRP